MRSFSAIIFLLCTFAHSVENEVGARIAENALAELVFPIVVVADATQRSLNTA